MIGLETSKTSRKNETFKKVCLTRNLEVQAKNHDLQKRILVPKNHPDFLDLHLKKFLKNPNYP